MGGAPRRTPDVRERRRDVPVELARICQKMMALKPQDRFASAAEASAALENWLQQAETARATVRAKAAARPRGGSETTASDPLFKANTRAAGVNLTAPPPESSAEPTGTPHKPNRRMQLVGVSVGVGVLAIMASVAVLLLRSGGGGPSGGAIANATTSGAGNGGTAVQHAPQVEPAKIDQSEAPDFYPLSIVKFNGPREAKFTSRADHSALIEGHLPAAAEYQLLTKIESPSITGLKIEVLPHFASSKGKNEPAKFRLSEIRVETAADEKFTAPKAVKIAQVTADFDEPKLTASQAFDGNRKTHWGADSQADRDHWAIFWFEKPLEGASAQKPLWIRATMDQPGKNQAIRQFRLAAATGTPPELLGGNNLPALAPFGPIASGDVPVVAYWRFEKPAAEEAGKGAPPAVEDASGNMNHLTLPEGSEPAKFTSAVPGAKVRSTGNPNAQSLDDLKSAKTKGGTWGLVTATSRRPEDLASLRLTAWTVEASFSLDQLGFTHALVGKDGPPKAGAKAPLQLRVRGDNDKIEIEAVDSSGAPRRVESTAAVVPGRWYHVVASSDGKQLRLWVDAGDGGGLEPQGGGVPFSGELAQGPGEWSVGRGFSDGQPADDALMLIDEVRITAAALDPLQMLMYATPADLAAEKAAPSARTVATATSSGPIKFHPLKILDVQGPKGVEFEREEDGSVLVTGTSPEKAVYTIRAYTDLTGISGFRLEALADHRLPGHGPGRHVSSDPKMQGNFVVTEVTVAASARESEQRPAPIAWKKVEADFSQDKFDVALIGDKKPAGGWAVSPNVGKGHYALLTAERSVGYSGGTWLTITIDQNFGKNFTLGRFRLTAFTGDKPGEDPLAGVLAANQMTRPLSKLPRTFTLPDLPAEGSPVTAEVTAAALIGTIFRTPNGSPVVLALWGGDTAVDVEGAVFSIEPDATAAEKSSRWKIMFKSPDTARGAPQVVAEVGVFGKDLKFHWTEQGASLPLANHLRNCVLEVKMGTQRRPIALRAPIAADRLDLGFGKTPSKPRYDIPWPPKISAMKFSLPPKQAEVPPYVLNHEMVSVGKGNAEITFSEQGQPDLISVIECSWKKGLQFNVSVFYLPTVPDSKRIAFSRLKVEKLGQNLNVQLNRWKAMLQSMEKPLPQGVNLLPQTEARKKQLKEQQIPEGEKTLSQIAKVLERVEVIDRAGGLPVQVFLEAGDFHLVLLQNNPE